MCLMICFSERGPKNDNGVIRRAGDDQAGLTPATPCWCIMHEELLSDVTTQAEKATMLTYQSVPTSLPRGG